MDVPNTTVDTQCGSSQQATNLAVALVAGGVVDVAIGCGVETMSRVPIGSNSFKSLGFASQLRAIKAWEEDRFAGQYNRLESIGQLIDV